MKTKQGKEELEKSPDEETIVEPKTRARKKASDLNEEDKTKPQDDPKTSKDIKKPAPRPKAVVKKRPLGIKKTKILRTKKVAGAKKKVLRQTVTRTRKTNKEVEIAQEKDTVPLIPATEIKKEPIDEVTPNSRSSSPKTAGRRVRLSSDMVMMKSVLGDSPSSLVLGPRTSPYSMRSERSNSPSLFEGKNLRSGKPRKVKNNLLNEVVMKEQKKRRRLLSDPKPADAPEVSEDCKKLKRGRSRSRDGSEISKCSDITESDVSLSETLNESELSKNLEKTKTELDIEFENNVQISPIGKVPSLSVDSKLTETKTDTEPSIALKEKDKKKLSLKRSTSLDSDNNNSNRIKLENINVSELEEKYLMKTEALFQERSNILNSMSKTFNSKEVSKNIRKARRGKKAATTSRPVSIQSKNGISSSTITHELVEDRIETVDTLSKEISDLINDLDQNIDQDQETSNDTNNTNTEQLQTMSARQFYGLSKPLGDNNSIITPETPIKDKDAITEINNECTPSKQDDSENIRLHYSDEKCTENRQEITYKPTSTVASIDKLMDRLKEFEEFDKKRQRQESESKSNDSKSVMVSNDVVLIPKSGADIKPLKALQPVRSPEKLIEKENVLSCFENNSAISIVKRDQVRRSIDVDLPNSVTLIKRNSLSARKESTSSTHSKESDAISIFEKSLGKDVTLTEIRKSVEKAAPAQQIDLHQYATLHPNNSSQALVSVLDSNQISITPRNIESKLNNEVQITKRKSSGSLSRKSSESGVETEEKMATIEKIMSPPPPIKSPVSITSTPVAVKSPESTQPMEAEALAPPLETVKPIPENISLTSEVPKLDSVVADSAKIESTETAIENKSTTPTEEVKEVTEPITEVKPETKEPEKPEQQNKLEEKKEELIETKPEEPKPKVSKVKSAQNSTENLPGPSNALLETPESQKRKENVLRTLGLLTHKAANEAKIEKLKEKERIYGNYYNSMGKGKAGKSDYTGTLKTVIKLNRGVGDRDKKKYRSSLKMTFQKSKGRSGRPQLEVGDTGGEDDFYTIGGREGAAQPASEGGHRKSHYSNRLNNHAAISSLDGEVPPEPEPKETLNLVIPEKASSFSIHPGRLCMDQCFYCGGKFGLFDTPCHIAQMKSSERQRKVLDNEEKLTIDSCLCDACYRHVDRRANCPSYRKRPVAKPPDAPPASPPPAPAPAPAPAASCPDKPLSPPPEEESDSEPASSARRAPCHTAGCGAPADHAIRRKWLIKMRSGVSKLLKLKSDYPGLHTIPLCAEHHRALAPLLACALCRRRLTKHHNLHFIHHDYADFNPLFKQSGIPVEFNERPVLCKVCRYYCTLLQRPGHNDKHAEAYTRKLLQIYKVEIPPEHQGTDDTKVLEDCNTSANKQKKKARNKSKQRKSTEPENQKDSESSERTMESSPEKEKAKEETSGEENKQHLEEDIESLISSNKILVPNAKTTESNPQSDNSEMDLMCDIETPLLPLDKQTELRYLLQKQNNPAQFQHKPNLTQKQRNILKVHNIGIQKPGQQHRVNEKNSKRVHKIGQILSHKDKTKKEELETEVEKPREVTILQNIPLNDECTIETIPNKKSADINTLKNKWQLSESFTQVKKNISELSKKLTVEKEPKKLDLKYSNPVKRLETNPSISVRELFPGEEEMNLQCNIEFNNVKGVTPEGWEKCNTTIQYDGETKKLWTELQRPYGNQSSFLRHLILLEKYFRSGDLILAHNASPHAANYSTSVQSRLRAYDNIASEPRRESVSLIEFRKKPSLNGKSLLKSNQNEEKDPKKFMPPPGFPKPKSKSEKKAKALPPELIAINTPNAQGRKAIQNVLHNIQQLVKGVSASDPTEVAVAPLPPKYDGKDKKDMPGLKYEPAKEKKDKKETPKKTKANSKGWRPNLMPITQENLAKVAREPLKLAVDGHSLPSLVQVLSGGTRYHITFEDYNKMCLIRRERQQKLQENKESKNLSLNFPDETTVITEIQPSTMLGNGGTVLQNISSEDKKELSDLNIGSNAATILKNVGLKNITIAPIPSKSSTITSQTSSNTSPSPLLVSTPIKIPQLGPAVSITTETITSMPLVTNSMILPKIPKSLTVIPQTVANVVTITNSSIVSDSRP